MKRFILGVAILASSFAHADSNDTIYFASLIQDEARLQDVDPVLALAIAKQESFDKLDPSAKRYEPKVQKDYKCSKSDATSYGIFQILPVFHKKRCGIKSNAQLLNARFNIKCGIKYLAYCTNKENTFPKAMKCWNGSAKYADKIRKQVKKLSKVK